MIGDRDVDMIAGKAAGTRNILIGDEEPGDIADWRFPTLFDAASFIVEKE
jgi:D-glycero-D-manno-heptose 1,7-bisphosphate phosphatase